MSITKSFSKSNEISLFTLKFNIMTTLVKTNTFPTLGSMMEDFWRTDRFLNQPFINQEMMPAVNFRDTKKGYELEMAAPGFKKDDFKITTENGLLTISAENKNEKKEEKENYTRQEFSYSSFVRTFSLPENVIEDDISANYKDGILTIDLKKSNTPKVKRKEVKIN